MKRIVILILGFSACVLTAGAQDHSLRAGVGINLINGADNGQGHKLSAGPALIVDYQYDFTEWVGFNVNFTAATNKFAGINNMSSTGGIVRAIFTPFAKSFRYLRVGGGGGWAYKMYNLKGVDNPLWLYPEKYGAWQLGLTARMFLVDNGKLEVYGAYEPYFVQNSSGGKLKFMTSTVSVNFGVRF